MFDALYEGNKRDLLTRSIFIFAVQERSLSMLRRDEFLRILDTAGIVFVRLKEVNSRPRRLKIHIALLPLCILNETTLSSRLNAMYRDSWLEKYTGLCATHSRKIFARNLRRDGRLALLRARPCSNSSPIPRSTWNNELPESESFHSFVLFSFAPSSYFLRLKRSQKLRPGLAERR